MKEDTRPEFEKYCDKNPRLLAEVCNAWSVGIEEFDDRLSSWKLWTFPIPVIAEIIFLLSVLEFRS